MPEKTIALVACLAVATFMSAGLNAASANSLPQQGAENATIKQVTRSSGKARKSDRQTCLDMLLPQDGAACLKKLKAKKK